MLKNPDNTWEQRSKQVIAHGALTNSKRPEAYVKGIFPSHIVNGRGCYLFDPWGNKYIDFVCGLGANILGYAHPKITEAVRVAAGQGPSLSLPTTLEVEVGEMIKELTGFERVRFFKTGTEACMAALRIARASTPGQFVANDGYHGWSDIFTSLTKPAAGVQDNFKIYPLESFPQRIVKGITFVEPIKLDASDDRKKELETLVEKKDGLVIFDEIITGLRVPNKTVTKWWRIKPDVLVLGKAFGNGHAISAVCMSKELADEPWFCSGTFCGEMTGLAACRATLQVIESMKDVDLWYYAQRFMNNLNDILKPIEVKVQNYGTRGYLPLESLNEALLLQEACKAGIILGKAFFWNYAHIESNIEEFVLNTITEIVNKIKGGSVKLEGEMPQSSFRRY